MRRNRSLTPFARLIFFVLLSFIITLSAQGESPSEPFREYRFLFGEPDEMEFIATTGVALNKVFQDIYFKGFGPMLPEKIAPFAEIFWQVYWTYFFSLWPHEYGHWARAQQIGGDFVFHGFSFPFPSAEMILPESIPLENQTLTSVGGFEINNLMKTQTHIDFYNNGFAHADELIHAFIQEVYFPFYVFVVAFASPEEPSTWTDTRGDPVEYTLSVYKKYTGRPAIREDGLVDSDLVSLYRENVYMNVLWTLLDPMLYQSAKAFAGDMKEDYGLMKPWWMLGDERIGWTYTTQFNPSPLGYELYFTNYLRLYGKLYTLYFRGGRPYMNLGVGVNIPALIETGDFTLGASCDYWDQDIYGSGGAVSVNMQYRFYKGFGLLLNGSWKAKGYLIGRRTEETPTLLAGFNYRF